MKLIYSILFSILLLSCNPSQQKIVLRVEKIYGLSNSSIVTLNQQKIGHINIVPNQSYAEIIIESNNATDLLKIPVNSKLQISDDGKSIGQIKIISRKSTKYLKSGDTLNWSKIDVEIPLEKTILVGDSLFVFKKKDSLNKFK